MELIRSWALGGAEESVTINDKIDALIGFHLFKARPCECACGRWYDIVDGKQKLMRNWSPSSNPSDACMVIERMQELGYPFEIHGGNYFPGLVLVKFQRARGEWKQAQGEIPRAICVAALRALPRYWHKGVSYSIAMEGGSGN